MEIQFGRYSIRSFRKSDIPSLVEYANNRNVSIHLRDSFPYPYRKADAEAWLRFVGRETPEVNFAIADAQELVGGIGLRLADDVYRCSAEVGYWLAEPHWNKGIVSAALIAFCDFVFSTFDLERLWATVNIDNPGSMRVLEKAGFLKEGTLRSSVVKYDRILDSVLYAKLRTDWRTKQSGSKATR